MKKIDGRRKISWENALIDTDQQRDFKNLKQEKWNCYPLEKFSSFSKESEGLAMSGLHLQVPRPPEFSFNQIKQWSTADP